MNPHESPNAVLYYLPFEGDPTRDLRARISHDDATPTLAEFATHYERVGADRAAGLPDVWARWNRGSGRESRAFLDAECRSLSVGDIVILDESTHLCAPLGWRPLALREREREADPDDIDATGQQPNQLEDE